jgi:hypothetical protein
VSDNLTPTAQAILDHLHEHPATATDLRQATGRSRSTIDKALTDLTKAGLVTKATPDGEAGDGPARWVLTDTRPDTFPEHPDPQLPDPQFPDSGTHPDDPPTDPDLPENDPDLPENDDRVPENDDRANPQAEDEPADDTTVPLDEQDDGGDQPDPNPPEEVKVCRGCGQQMPKTCPTCRSKTTAYCGTCRKTQPTRRRAPGEPQILANGLPKLLPGQLERLVADVIRTQPLPDHLDITGWTPGRVAIFLPGRSTGAIANALDKLTATGQAQLLGDNPKRYQPTPDPQPPSDVDPQDDSGDTSRE